VLIGRVFALFPERILVFPLSAIGGAALIAGFTLININVYLYAQARWVKDISIALNLRDLPSKDLDGISILLVDDRFPISGVDVNYRFYEYSRIFKFAWGKEKILGLRKNTALYPDKIKNLPLHRFLLKDFDF